SVHVPPPSNDTAADFLDALHRLPTDQKQSALVALQKVPPEVKPALIKQWVHRCDMGSVRNPLGYLMTLVATAVRGDFNSNWKPDDKPRLSHMNTGSPSTGSSTVEVAQPVKAMMTPRNPESIQTANQTLSEMLNLLKPQRGTLP
ncbi:MAG: hypothetical protein M3O11_07315, partial [Pseudomonadota bacterium]|nr:hypothetical protein [Pseudomonadota bacterium]